MANQPKKPGSGAAGDMLTAHLLAMLKGWTAYGYDLAQRLEEAGLGDYNKGTIYRTLRHMEALGLVSSNWDTSLNGPARRMYSLTNAGSLFLQNWLTILDAHKSMVAQFMNISPSTQAKTPAPSNKKKPRKKSAPKKSTAKTRDEPL